MRRSAGARRADRSLADDWGIAVLLVEHNLDLVLSVCDVVTVMDSGVELLAAAPPPEVRTHPDVLEAYIGVRTDDGVRAPHAAAREAERAIDAYSKCC